jgi:signal transduction histidine kinase
MLLQIEEIQLTIAVGSIVVVFFAAIIVITIVQYKKRSYRHMLEKEQMKAEFSEALLQTHLEIKEQTLQNVARELHDNVGQTASLIKIYLNTLTMNNPTTADGEKVDQMKELMKQLIYDIKVISVGLNGDRVARLGVSQALKGEIDRLNKSGQYECSLVATGEPPVIDDNTTVILFRMGQEILNNSTKHSEAKHIHISLTSQKKLFKLEFRDDGRGFDVAEVSAKGGSGLLNLRTRARLIGAQLTIESTPEDGTTVIIELPLYAAGTVTHD